MTRAQLDRFIRIRNKSGFNSNLQFISDAEEAGFDAVELGNATKHDFGTYTWTTPYGTLTERDGCLTLEPAD